MDGFQTAANSTPPQKKEYSITTKVICAIIIIASLIVIGWSMTRNTITKSEFDRIQTGMTLEQVQQIVGAPGELGANASVGSYSSSIYTFKGVLYTINGANANVTFSNGRVVGKAQIGLIF